MLFAILASPLLASAQDTNPVPVFEIKADQVTTKVNPLLYGLMTEEINFAFEGGLYGELVRNRTFKANPTNAVYWKAVNGSISLDTNQPLNSALNVSLKLDTSGASPTKQVGIANDGYWGIGLQPNTTYHASFYAKAKNFSGELTVSLVHVADPKNVTLKLPPGDTAKLGEMTLPVASATVSKISGDWQKYEVTLTTGNIVPSKENRLVISTTKPGSFFNHHGTVWFQQVSLFPPTYKDRPNGNRADLMQLMADMKPAFLRFPGGNYLEGDYFNERFDWKKTIGPIEQRPGHRSPWNYWSTDGFGLPEFLGWCEDLNMEPVLAVFAGYVLKHDYVKPGPDLEPYVQEALEEIEYVTGDAATTKWGAQRAKDGHPAPFKLTYVEIGNEDWFDKSLSYDGRFAQFYDAIKAKYPQLKIISTVGLEHPASMRVHSRTPDVVDEHYYRAARHDMEAHANDYDNRKRDGGPKIFVGEWATRIGSPTPNISGALGDAAWMAGMERNSDIIVMSCYAPLFVNVSDLGNPNRAERSMQWPSDLIGYDALTSYGSPSYYAQQMFSTLHGDEVLATSATGIPVLNQSPARPPGADQPAARPAAQTLFFNATRDSKTKTIFLKVVNCAETAQVVNVNISGANSIAASGSAVVLKGDKWDDTNTIQDPKKVVPVTETVDGLGASFTRTFPALSVTVLQLKTQ
jgi:alpha-N-arabinofuranosidase